MLKSIEPLHRTMESLARCCIDEALVEEAESIVGFLEPRVPATQEMALLRIWLMCQRGCMLDALLLCASHMEQFGSEAAELRVVLALLRHHHNDPGWRADCEQLLASPAQPVEVRQIAAALLDGSFGASTFKVGGTTTAMHAAPPASVGEDRSFAGASAFVRA